MTRQEKMVEALIAGGMDKEQAAAMALTLSSIKADKGLSKEEKEKAKAEREAIKAQKEQEFNGVFQKACKLLKQYNRFTLSNTTEDDNHIPTYEENGTIKNYVKKVYSDYVKRGDKEGTSFLMDLDGVLDKYVEAGDSIYEVITPSFFRMYRLVITK